MFINKVFIPINTTTVEGDIPVEIAIPLISVMAGATLFLIGYTIYTLIKVSRY